MNPLDVQIGGHHYKQYAIQPVELYNSFNLGFGEANCIKYSMRHMQKNKVEDLEKVIHYTQLMIKFHNPVGNHIPQDYIDRFAHSNKLDGYAKEVIEEIGLWLMNRSAVHLNNIIYATKHELHMVYGVKLP